MQSASPSREIKPVYNRHHPIHILQLPTGVLQAIISYFGDPHDVFLACPLWKEFHNQQLDFDDENARPVIWDRRQTIHNLRLVCRVFNYLASPLLFAALGLDVSQASLDFIKQLAEIPNIARGVRTISLYLYYRPLELAADLSRFRRTRQNDLTDLYDECVRYRYGDNGWNVNEWDVPDKALDKAIDTCNDALEAWNANHAYFDSSSPNLTPEKLFQYQQCLLKGYEDYRKLHKEQFRLINQGIFADGLTSLLTQMPHLRELCLEDETYMHYPTSIALDPTMAFSSMENLRRYMGVPYEWSRIQERHGGERCVPARLLLDLPVAVFRAGVSLRQLRICCLPTIQSFSMLSHAPHWPWSVAWDDFYAACSDLESITIEQGHYTNPELLLENTFEQKALFDKFFSGALSSHKLRDVCIHFSYSVTIPHFHSVGSVISAATWPCLRSLQLSAVAFKQYELERMCRDLAPNMALISLSCLQVTAGYWSATLNILRDKYAARCARGECNLLLYEPQGGEFDKGELKEVRYIPLSSLQKSGWCFTTTSSVVGQLAEMYIRAVGVMENPLDGNISRILSNGPSISA